MTFSAKDMIKQRKSVRTFDGKPLSVQHLRKRMTMLSPKRLKW